MLVSNWMSWEGGVDLCALSSADLTQPNIIVHVARMVHTPVGSAPAGMVLFQPHPAGPPLAFGFVSPDPVVGAYFGPHIFAGTPFETAPVIPARITITASLKTGTVAAHVEAAGWSLGAELSGLGETVLVNREPAAMTPFQQQGVEAAASAAAFTFHNQPHQIIVPPVGITGGPAAVWSACGVYAR